METFLLKEDKIDFYFMQSGEIEHYTYDVRFIPDHLLYLINIQKVELRRDDGPAVIFSFSKRKLFNSTKSHKVIQLEVEFAKDTKHLVCNSCNNFCNQGCFYEKN